MYIAVVMKHVSENETIQKPGACTAATREEAVRSAMKLRNEWTARGDSGYRIFVGELTTEVVEVVVPVAYEEVPIEL